MKTFAEHSKWTFLSSERKGSFHFIVFQTLWEYYFWMFSEYAETSSNISKILDERPTKRFRNKTFHKWCINVSEDQITLNEHSFNITRVTLFHYFKRNLPELTKVLMTFPVSLFYLVFVINLKQNVFLHRSQGPQTSSYNCTVWDKTALFLF